MTLPAIIILFGAMVLYGGWTNRSVWALARGDNQTPKNNGDGITKTPLG